MGADGGLLAVSISHSRFSDTSILSRGPIRLRPSYIGSSAVLPKAGNARAAYDTAGRLSATSNAVTCISGL